MSTSTIQQIRPVIECFCQILSLYGFSNITPEIFRLAKFNRDEATIPMWRLIFELLHFDLNNSNQQSFIEQFNRTAKDQLVETMKNDLFTRGYTYEQFLLLDSQMRQGSQQLLLCIGWLIHHLNVIPICIEQCLKSQSILDYDDTSALYQGPSTDSSPSASQEKDLLGQVKQAMRVNSKLRFGLRRLHGLVIENANLQHQIHQCHNMSALEAYLCQHPHLLSHYMIELDIEHRKLNVLSFWNEHEDVFWKWLESVLDQTDQQQQEQEDDRYEPLNSTDSQRLETEKKKFHAAIDTLDNALTRLEQLWISNDDRNSIERDVSSMVTTIDDQVSSLFSQLLATNPSSSKKISSDPSSSYFLHQPQRLVYAKASDIQGNQQSIQSNDFERETTRLQRLQTSIDQHIEKQRTILDTLSHQFDDVMIV